MNKQKKSVITLIFTLTILLIFLSTNKVWAFNTKNIVTDMEYSQEYLDWLELDEDIRANSIMPRMYNIYSSDREFTNPVKLARLLGSTTQTKFNLKDYISNNMVIKNQGNLGACWTFSNLAGLETNLALKDYYNNKTTHNYDFSERHMEYSTTKTFLNNQINENGFNRASGDGGSSALARAYLTNGMGAIDEKDMPYVDSNELINISEIQNKTVTSQVYDITEFSKPVSTDEKEALKTKMKEQIKNYGGIDAGIHEDSNCLNTQTGALYCSNPLLHVVNHDVLIVGWDDDYNINNFSERSRPTKNGAWIIKDSHGTNEDCKYTFAEFKEMLFKAAQSTFEQQGITSASQITDDLVRQYVERAGYTIENDKVYMKHNDDGYLYVSYDDANIYSTLMAITKAENSVNYDNIYQYDYLGATNAVTFTLNNMYIASVFQKNTTKTEELTQVSISTPETVTCKVYVNPNGTSKNKDDLKLVQLKQGESQTIDVGYHTLEFLNPIDISGENFVVAIEIQGKRSSKLGISIEFDYPDFYKRTTGNDIPSNAVEKAYGGVKIENNKCFYANEDEFNKNNWSDFSDLYNSSDKKYPDSDITIKAFTKTKEKQNELTAINIKTPPTKTEYTEGENFSSKGMIVEGLYQDGTKKDITEYKIENGTDLKLNQKSVTITYNEKTVEQPITVKAKTDIPEDNKNDEPKNSDFKNLKLDISSIKFYTFSDLNKEEYVTIDVTLSNIAINTTNDSYKYYYYLSQNQKETNIENWVEIKDAKVQDGKLQFEINTKDIKNYDDIKSADTLYLYVKEIVQKGTKQATLVTDSMSMASDIKAELYVDGVKFETKDDNNGSNNNATNNNNTSNKNQNQTSQISTNKIDATKTSNVLPFTGIKTILILIFIITIISVVVYIRYKDLSKYIK